MTEAGQAPRQAPAARRQKNGGARRRIGGRVRSLVQLFVLVLLWGCDSPPEVIGNWRQVGKTAILNLKQDGTFEAIDNQGMQVRGRFAHHRDGSTEFEVFRPGLPPETVHAVLFARDDELRVSSPDGGAVEHYRRRR